MGIEGDPISGDGGIEVCDSEGVEDIMMFEERDYESEGD